MAFSHHRPHARIIRVLVRFGFGFGLQHLVVADCNLDLIWRFFECWNIVKKKIFWKIIKSLEMCKRFRQTIAYIFLFCIVVTVVLLVILNIKFFKKSQI